MPTFGSWERNRTPTFELAIPVLGMAGHDETVGVPLGTRPNLDGSYVELPRLIVTLASSAQWFARNTAKQGGTVSEANDGVATTKSQPTEP
jgi:hypothetical protein